MIRTKGILAAGTFTGLVLITVLVLGFGTLQAKAGEDPAATLSPAEVITPTTDGIAVEQALQEWQTYSQELEQTIRTMQDRETIYQQQLDTANQTIMQQQNEINGVNDDPLIAFSEEHESREHESHEREEFDD